MALKLDKPAADRFALVYNGHIDSDSTALEARMVYDKMVERRD